jgi:hypothetical protein
MKNLLITSVLVLGIFFALQGECFAQDKAPHTQKLEEISAVLQGFFDSIWDLIEGSIGNIDEYLDGFREMFAGLFEAVEGYFEFVVCLFDDFDMEACKDLIP